jgi:hypothetical protein
VSTSNHTHSMTPASHTLNHQHGGSGTTFSSDGYGERANPQWNNGAQTQSASAGSNFSWGARLGHSHLVTHTIAATDPTLSAAATQPVGSVSGTQAMPPHKRLVLIRKV